MAITATAYGPLGLRLLKGEIDVDTATLSFSLHTASYVPDQAHDYFDDVTNEASGTGYTAGGEDLTTLVAAYDAENQWTALTADPTTWTDATISYRYGVLRVNTGVDSTSPLVLWADFGSTQSVVADDIEINWNALGFLRLLA